MRCPECATPLPEGAEGLVRLRCDACGAPLVVKPHTSVTTEPLADLLPTRFPAVKVDTPRLPELEPHNRAEEGVAYEHNAESRDAQRDMVCVNCDSIIGLAAICPECGARRDPGHWAVAVPAHTRRCMHCGTPNPLSFAKCADCGSRMV